MTNRGKVRIALLSLLTVGCSCFALEDVASVIQALSAESVDQRLQAIVSLGDVGERAKSAIPLLLRNLSPFKRSHPQQAELVEYQEYVRIRVATLQTIGKLGVHAKDAMPILEQEMKSRPSRLIVEVISKVSPDVAVSAFETLALQCCKDYCEAQNIFHRVDYNGDGILEYAQHFKGDNSLSETKSGMNDLALIDAAMADAEFGHQGKKSPDGGYWFKTLGAQGNNARGGKRTYLENGKLTLGYALIAFPAEYGKSGKRTFMIAKDGESSRLLAKDLGAETVKLAGSINEFDPDNSWIEEKAR